MSPTRAPALHPDPAGPLRVGRGLLVVLLAGLVIVSCGVRRAPDHRDALADVPGLTGVAAVDATGNHSLALTADGRVLAWGSTEAGVGGPAPDEDCADRTPSSTYYPCRPTPAVVPLPARAVAVASSDDQQFALLGDGSVWAWGADHHAPPTPGWESCPSSYPYPCHRFPTRVDGLPPVVALSGGLDHVLALDREGRVWQWDAAAAPTGTASCAGVADTRRDTCSPDPVLVAGLPPVTTLASHLSTASYALDRDGGVWRWPDATAGWTADRVRPVRVPIPMPVADVAAGSENAEAVYVGRDGSVWVTGRVDGLAANDCGRSCALTPVEELGPGSASGTMRLGGLRVRTTDGQVLVRSRDGASPTMAGPLRTWTRESDLDAATAIAIGDQHTLALLPDGRVRAKGYNADGELGL